MTVIDYAILAIIGFFGLVSFSRGIVTELVAILRWIISIMVATLYYKIFSNWFFTAIEPLWLQQTLAFITLFLICFIVLNFAGKWLNKIIKWLGLDDVNHVLGILLGIIKGLLVVLVVVFIASFTDIVTSDAWQNSRLLPYFMNTIALIAPFIENMLANKQ